MSQTNAPLSRGRQLVLAWLESIEETDQDVIAEVLQRFETDTEARDYFLKRASEVAA